MKRLFPILGAIAVVTFIALTIARAPDNPAPTAVPHYQSTTIRTVKIVNQPLVSTGEGPVVAELERGQIPPEVTTLTVLTDENCQPDENGVSHCLNQVRFQSTQGTGEATLQHHHRMAEESCLAPGETLALTR